MADEPKTDGPSENPAEANIPPKLDLSKNGAAKQEPAAADPKSETIHIKMPSDLETPSPETPKLVIKPNSTVKTAVRLKPSASGDAPESPAAKKKETSRIPLDEASTDPSEGIGKPTKAPKTIRIKPITKKAKVTPGVVTPAEEGAQTAPLDEKRSTAQLDDKRKTSRISLDSVFQADENKSEAEPEAAEKAPERPKTIRLKRPSEAATIKIAQRPKPAAAAPPAATPSEVKTVLSKTSRIEEDGIEEEEGDGGISPTRRKTIRVKRPTEQAGVKGLSIKRTDEEELESPEELAVPMVVEDRPNPVFPILAIAAILVVCVTTYMFMAQTFGYNACLTQTSYWNGMNLDWPGKIRP